MFGIFFFSQDTVHELDLSYGMLGSLFRSGKLWNLKPVNQQSCFYWKWRFFYIYNELKHIIKWNIHIKHFSTVYYPLENSTCIFAMWLYFKSYFRITIDILFLPSSAICRHLCSFCHQYDPLPFHIHV